MLQNMVLYKELLNTIFNLGAKWMFKEWLAFFVQCKATML